jgi:hypothetical protein
MYPSVAVGGPAFAAAGGSGHTVTMTEHQHGTFEEPEASGRAGRRDLRWQRRRARDVLPGRRRGVGHVHRDRQGHCHMGWRDLHRTRHALYRTCCDAGNPKANHSSGRRGPARVDSRLARRPTRPPNCLWGANTQPSSRPGHYPKLPGDGVLKMNAFKLRCTIPERAQADHAPGLGWEMNCQVTGSAEFSAPTPPSCAANGGLNTRG